MTKPLNSTPIEQVVLEDGHMSVSLLSYGAITQGWWIRETPLILGYENIQDYLTDPYYLGAIVGRVANRIEGAQFALQGAVHHLTVNEGSTTLHGGLAGLSHRHWGIRRITSNQATLSLTSFEGDGGFPGLVKFELHVELGFPRLTYTITAWPDRPTPISIAQHNYYTLGCQPDILDCRLKLKSRQVLKLDEQAIPSGLVSDVCKGVMDFTTLRTIGEGARDLDHYFLFERGSDPHDPVAEVQVPLGLRLHVYSDQPGAQVYSAAHLSDPFKPGAGLCIEPSGYPNAVNIPSFPSVIHGRDAYYQQRLTLEILEDQT